MKRGTKLTKQQLDNELNQLKTVFDMVRVVDPYHTQVLDSNLNIVEEQLPCYNVWCKHARCTNCISLKAYTQFVRKSKIEMKEDKAFSVISMPYIVTDKNDKRVVVEMVNEISGEMNVYVEGEKIFANTIAELDSKLYRDSLTGVYNRRYFDEHKFVFKSIYAGSNTMTFIYIDIRHFKHINDTYGHYAGDEVLKAVAATLKKQIRKEEPLIRMGGDEFLITLKDIKEKNILDLIERLKNSITTISLKEIEFYPLEVNCGYAVDKNFDPTEECIEALEKAADREMYLEKNKKIVVI